MLSWSWALTLTKTPSIKKRTGQGRNVNHYNLHTSNTISNFFHQNINVDLDMVGEITSDNPDLAELNVIDVMNVHGIYFQ